MDDQRQPTSVVADLEQHVRAIAARGAHDAASLNTDRLIRDRLCEQICNGFLLRSRKLDAADAFELDLVEGNAPASDLRIVFISDDAFDRYLIAESRQWIRPIGIDPNAGRPILQVVEALLV